MTPISLASYGEDNMQIAVFGGILVGFLAITGSQAIARGPEVAPANDFAGLSYAINTRSEVIVFAGLRNVGGQVGVCGMVWTNNATNTAKRLERAATQRIRFSVLGQDLRVSTSEFIRYDSEEQALAGTARCSVTRTAWQDGYANAALEMGLSKGTLRD
jgi:hypothetical protein